MANATPQVETRAADRDQQLSTIFEVARILVTEQDLEAMLPKFLSCLIATLEAADTGMLLLYNEPDGQLTVSGAQGYDFTTLSKIYVAPGEAMSGKAFQTGQVGLYSSPEAIAAARENLRPENRELFGTATSGLGQPRSAVCIPLVAGQMKVGALLLENRSKSGSFAHDEIPFLRAVADVIALSIENAHLRKKLRDTRALEEANRLKAELISTLAHEMRTPLTSIKGYSTALLMEEATFDPESQQEFLKTIDEECDVLQDLIHDLLESSIIDAGLLRLELQPVRLPRLVQSVTDDTARHSKKHRFLIDFPKDFPIVDVDPHRIGQVLRNLMDNAAKYSPEGGLIVVRGEVREDEVVVSVADQGVGIAPEDLNRLFEKFFRVEWGLGRHVVGSGLGLPIARTIVESHGGRIWAESQLGEGSTFHFTLPLKGLSQEMDEQE
ncbi:MAG: GAF domain-containing protein [Chloroflexi bacterium]|nr:GAF domain-containing protein [Chloroflexota bacterium]